MCDDDNLIFSKEFELQKKKKITKIGIKFNEE
jgi:hypothetical protein